MSNADANEIERLRNELEEEREKKKILKVVLDMAYDGIVIVDIKGNIDFISKPYADFLGVNEQEVVGRAVAQVIENTRMDVVVKTGKGEEAQLQKIGNRSILANREPIIVDGEVKGAVGKVLFKNVRELNHLYKKFGNVQKELENYKEEIARQYSAKYSFSDIIGNDSKILEAKEIAKKAGQTDSSVLITGESGTGKELFAHAIHKVSTRVYGRFIKVNCAAIPSDLLESELFGYERGAFTGANKEGKLGKFELADGGTIFLDEIGDMPLHMQVKLLRVLQEREVERVGGVSPRDVDIRIIAATNQNLEKMVNEGRFRADLYYRLNVVTIKIPPLRERKDDIMLLSDYLSKKVAKKFDRAECIISPKAMEYLKNYEWKGNVRQLENIIERAFNVMNVGDRRLLPEHLPKEITGMKVAGRVVRLEDLVAETEKEAIDEAIRACGGNKRKAAEGLGISRTTLYEKMEKYLINR